MESTSAEQTASSLRRGGAAPFADQSPGISVVVSGMSKHYGKLRALDGVSLEIRRGNVLALLGPNGAGKTTLVRILAGLIDPDSGFGAVAGFDVVKNRTELRNAIGLAGQFAAVDELLTGRENLELVGRLYHLGRDVARERASGLLQRFGLSEAADRMVKTYSGGMRRRLDLAASLIANPKVLFLDEPTTGLDPASRKDLWNMIRDLVSDGTTVLLTTQYLDEADQLADDIIVLDRGRIIAQGSAAELKARIGGQFLSVRLNDRDALGRATEVFSRYVDDLPRVDPVSVEISVAVTNGGRLLAGIIRDLDEAGIEISEIGIRQPTLDEVFLSLTGETTESAASPNGTGGGV